MKRIILFLALTFSLSWAVEFWLMANGGMSHPYWRVFLSGVMLLPALCSLLTRLITKEGFSNMMLGLRLKSCKKTWLIAWFGPAVLILIGAGIYFLIFPSHFDSGFSVMRSMLQGVQNADGTTAEITTEVIVSAFLSQI